jgi:hypothetical protein
MLNNLQVNKYGLLGFVLVTLMLIIRMIQAQVPETGVDSPVLYRILTTVTDPYILMSIVPYVVASLIINRRLDSRLYTKRHLSARQRLIYQNIYIGIQIALVFLIVGLFLGLNYLHWQLIYFVAVVAFSMFIPFQVLSKREAPLKDDSLEL